MEVWGGGSRWMKEKEVIELATINPSSKVGDVLIIINALSFVRDYYMEETL